MTAIIDWRYRGRDTAGRLVKGKMEAASQSAVVTRLRGMGIAPIAIERVASGTGLQTEIRMPGAQRRSVPLKAIALASRQLSTMVGAGVPLLRALTILGEQTQDRSLARALHEVRDRVQAGSALSDALLTQPHAFPPFMVHMVRAGETGGFLDGALESVSNTFERDVRLRAKIKSAMTYPVIVLLIALLCAAVMMIFIVPIFKTMFAGLGADLPLPTQILVTISDNMIWIGPTLAVLVIVGWFWWRRNRHSEALHRRMDPVLLRLPVFGALIRKLAIARFTRNLAVMIGAGVPILRGLDIVAETSGNWVVKQAAIEVRDSVAQGRSIAEPLAAHAVFPPMVSQMVAVGEDSGQLQLMLEKIAAAYDDEVEAMTDQLTSLIEPILIAFMGVLIGGMVIALYLPMFTITQHIGR